MKLNGEFTHDEQVLQVDGQAAETPSRAQRDVLLAFATHEHVRLLNFPPILTLNGRDESSHVSKTSLGCVGDAVGASVRVKVGAEVGEAVGDEEAGISTSNVIVGPAALMLEIVIPVLIIFPPW